MLHVDVELMLVNRYEWSMIFDDMLVEETEVKVILPEGISDVELVTPYAMTRRDDDKHYTYLDTTGRTVVTFYTNKLLTENHIQDFQIGLV